MKKATITIVIEQEVENGPVHFRELKHEGLDDPYEGIQMCCRAQQFFMMAFEKGVAENLAKHVAAQNMALLAQMGEIDAVAQSPTGKLYVPPGALRGN